MTKLLTRGDLYAPSGGFDLQEKKTISLVVVFTKSKIPNHFYLEYDVILISPLDLGPILDASDRPP